MFRETKKKKNTTKTSNRQKILSLCRAALQCALECACTQPWGAACAECECGEAAEWQRMPAPLSLLAHPLSTPPPQPSCTTATARYTCPRCRAPYCGLDCYRCHGDACTESFYR